MKIGAPGEPAFADELSWVAPFVARAAELGLIDLTRLARVEPWPSESVAGIWDEPEGACWPEASGGGAHTIQIATTRRVRIGPGGMLVRPVSRRDQLETLAHELAHLSHRDHDRAHEVLTSRIHEAFTDLGGPAGLS